ncbi:MAG: amidohydrolase [Thermoflexales bacterium]|nr:amidohydrolase [Thermoflexales bacterium]MDW8293186.1 amidohydrolase [Anaerolineae bacterium]
MALLIRNATLVLPQRVIERGWLRIEGRSIAAMGAGESPMPQPEDALIEKPALLVLPGLVNAHTHLEQTFMRGYAGGKPLIAWLKHYVWKLQAAMTVEDVRLATLLGLLDALRGGATTIVDHHKVPFSHQHTDVVLETAAQLGVRLVLARAWADTGAEAEAASAILDDLRRLFAEWHGAAEGRIRIANGPLAPWRCSAAMLQRTTSLARQHNAITHCHVSETQHEVALTMRATGLRPVQWLARLGVLGADFHAVHSVWLDDEEIALLQRHSAQVTHCPVANAILASGVAPVARLLRAGVRVALGTDGPASNDAQDLLETMRWAAYLQRAHTLDPEALPPRTALRLALQRPDGSEAALQPGAPADLTLIDLDRVHIQPVHDPLAALVYCARNGDVWGVIVDGRLIMRAGRFVEVDEAALLAECRDRARHLARRAGLLDD